MLTINPSESTKGSTSRKSEEDEDEEYAGSDSEEDEPNAPVEASLASSKSRAASVSKQWSWRKDFMEIIRHKSGLVKLRADKPSTAAIGNWGILEAVERQCESTGLGSSTVIARLFMGKKKSSKSKVDVPLLKKDNESVIQSQWDALR